MRFEVMAGVLAVALAAAASARAETAAEPGGVPTVTVINKDAAAAEEPNAVSIVEDAELAPEAVAPPLPEAAADAGALVDGEPEEMAEAEPAPPPTPTLHIDINLTRQQMTVSEGSVVLHTWPISSGRRGYRTPTGSFQPTWMARRWFSRQYDNAPMPHSIFFHKGVAIHGSMATRSLGRPASHGCVRLAPKNAAALFRLVTRHGKDRTQIVVHGTPNHGAPAVASHERGPRGTRARTSPYPYLPPSAAARAAYGPPPGYVPPRARRRTAQQQHYAPRPPRGLFTPGYGF